MIDISLSEQELHKRLSNATEAVRAMALTDQSRALLSMLDAMAAIYTLELIHSDTDKRMAVRQVLQLRRVVAGEEHSAALI